MARLVVAARGVWGAALLIAPQKFAASHDDRNLPAVRIAARVLAARQLGESALLAREPQSRPPTWAIAVDLVHAASMLAVAVASRGLRRDALRSAGVATALSALSASQR